MQGVTGLLYHLGVISDLGIGLPGPVHVCDVDNSLSIPQANGNGFVAIAHLNDDSCYRLPSLWNGFCPLFLEILHEGFNGFRCEMLKRSAVPLTFIQIQQPFFNFLSGDPLHVDVDGGVNLQAVVIERLGTVFLFDILAHVFRIKGHLLNVQVAPWPDVQFGGDGLRGLDIGDVALFDHSVKNVDLALLGPIRILEGGIPARRLGQSGQHGTLGKVHVARGFTEVVFGCRFHAVSTVSQIDLIEI